MVQLAQTTYFTRRKACNYNKVSVNIRYLGIQKMSPRWFGCYRYFATGNSFKALAFSFRVGASTEGNIVKETTVAL